jgi:hypothetical protein
MTYNKPLQNWDPKSYKNTKIKNLGTSILSARKGLVNFY